MTFKSIEPISKMLCACERYFAALTILSCKVILVHLLSVLERTHGMWCLREANPVVYRLIPAYILKDTP